MLIDFLAKILKLIFKVLGREKSVLISSILSEKLTSVIGIKTKHGVVSFYCYGGIPVWRAQTLLTKEPETIAWIDQFNVDDVFWDIGANMGVYSLYAATKGVNVVAFEPSAANYYLLNKNIEINKISDKIKAYCLAFNNDTLLDKLYMSNMELGGAHSSFSHNINQHGESFTPKFAQAMLGFSIHEFIKIFSIEFPNHIKIDVDGIEDQIIDGSDDIFCDSRLKTILIELDPNRMDYSNKIIKKMRKYGLYGGFTNDKNTSGYNVIFYRS